MTGRDHFYKGRPAHTHWRDGVAACEPASFDPVVAFPFRIGRDDKVATAGSCFAQHIARHLRNTGFSFLVTETAHPIARGLRGLEEEFSYGTFSARFGNIYTTRQLLQLYDRAYGEFIPDDAAWQDASGRWFDPFRPAVEPGGFASLDEMLHDREQHLAAARKMFETLDVFVFTLGLTECWVSASDGAVYPVCPGVIAGAFEPSEHLFVNLSVLEVIEDLRTFITRLASVNPAARIILTVSPVPLMATAEDRHVWTSTVASKSVLRVACDEITKTFGHVAYFPSFEVITSIKSRGAYFGADCRSVTEAGVRHVMGLFFRHATTGAPTISDDRAASGAARRDVNDPDAFLRRAEEIVEVICEESAIDRSD